MCAILPLITMKIELENVLFFSLSAWLFTQSWSFAQEEVRVDSPASQAVEAYWLDCLQDLPNCGFKYSIDIPGKTLHCEFSRFEDCFRLSNLSADGTVSDAISFDGSTYYHLFSDGLQLSVSSEKPEAEFSFSQKFKTNPLYFSLALISEGNFKIFGSRFYPAHLSGLSKVNKLELPLSTLRPAAMFEGGESLLECVASLDGATKLVYFDPLNPSRIVGASWEVQPKLFERWAIKDSIVLNQDVDSGQFFLPTEIIREFAFEKYAEAYSGEELPRMRIVVDKDSIRTFKGDLERERFRIPRTAARLLRDVDIGSVINLNEGVTPQSVPE